MGIPDGEEVHHDEQSYMYDTFVENQNWSMVDDTEMRRVIIAMYFAFTTLSTAGLGDYYPVSDMERLVGAFLLLIGVAIFSYIMGELLTMLVKFKNLNINFGQDEELERFFLLLKKYNYGQSLDGKLQNKIQIFLNFKWMNDRNNFLVDEQDKKIFNQMPIDCQRQIYTDFIFQEFLFKFRRFFSFRIAEIR